MENLNQFYNLTESEMLALWKQVMRLETPRRDCTVEWDDGIARWVHLGRHQAGVEKLQRDFAL